MVDANIAMSIIVCEDIEVLAVAGVQSAFKFA